MGNIVWNLITKTWRTASVINDKLFRGGADFSDWMTQDELGFSETEGNKYQPSSGIIKRVVRRFDISSNDNIIDIGCGKGRAMFMLSRYGFGSVDGYDISEYMVDLANKNFAKVGISDKCKAFCANALSFTEYDKYNYFYAFNPVPREVFEIMMDNIVLNIKQHPRECCFIYLNPVYDDYISNHTPFERCYTKKAIMSWNSVYVYTLNLL